MEKGRIASALFTPSDFTAEPVSRTFSRVMVMVNSSLKAGFIRSSRMPPKGAAVVRVNPLDDGVADTFG